jgi:hypothetical protein
MYISTVLQGLEKAFKAHSYNIDYQENHRSRLNMLSKVLSFF